MFFSKNVKIKENVAIVGSSPNLLHIENGGLIDSAGTVIRFNLASVIGFEKYVGGRTDIRVVGQTIRPEHLSKLMKIEEYEEPLIITKDKNVELLRQVYPASRIILFSDYTNLTRSTFKRLEPYIGSVTNLNKRKRPTVPIICHTTVL